MENDVSNTGPLLYVISASADCAIECIHVKVMNWYKAKRFANVLRVVIEFFIKRLWLMERKRNSYV